MKAIGEMHMKVGNLCAVSGTFRVSLSLAILLVVSKSFSIY